MDGTLTWYVVLGVALSAEKIPLYILLTAIIIPQGNFFRQIRNFIIDTSEVKNEDVRGLHYTDIRRCSIDSQL